MLLKDWTRNSLKAFSVFQDDARNFCLRWDLEKLGLRIPLQPRLRLSLGMSAIAESNQYLQ